MNNDRRHFLATTSTVGLTSMLLPGQVLAQLVLRQRPVMKRDHYGGRLGDWFYLHDADDRHQGNLQLMTIENVATSKHLDQFNLLLRSYRQADVLPSGYYQVAAEPFDLFVKYSHSSDGQHWYRAEFSLLR